MKLVLLLCIILSHLFPLPIQELPGGSDSSRVKQQSGDQLSVVNKLHGSLGRLEDESYPGEKLSRPDGIKHLSELAVIHRRNRSRVRTWSGIGDTSFWHRKNGGIPRLNRFEFSLDQELDAEKVKVSSLQKNAQEKLVGVFSQFVMRVGGDLYKVRPQFGVADQIHKIVITHGKLEPGFEAGDFSPIYYFTINDRLFEDNTTVFKSFFEKGQANITVWKGPRFSWIQFRVPKQREQNLVLEVDRQQGANVTRFVSSSVFEFERRVCSYQKLGGAWVPERMHRAVIYKREKDQFQDRSHLTIFNNKVNAKLPTDAFKISGLGLGDQLAIEDKRTGMRLNYDKDRKPEPAKLPGIEESNSGSNDKQDRAPVTTAIGQSGQESRLKNDAPRQQFLKQFGLFVGVAVVFYSVFFLFSSSPESTSLEGVEHE